jgi:hypothetical protein
MENTDPKDKKVDFQSEKIEEIFVIERHFHHDDVESPHSIDELDNYDEHESYTSFVDEDDQFDDD